MIRFEHTEVTNFHVANRGMRNSFESWDAIDSYYVDADGHTALGVTERWVYGPNDWSLASRLAKASASHRKYMRQILVSVDITAPLYFFKQFDQYKVGVVTNSTSTMHTIQRHEFVASMFSVEDLDGYAKRVESHPVKVDEKAEEWRDYPHNSLYLVSNQGRVKRLAYVATNGHHHGEKVLKGIVQSDDYLRVNILVDGKRKSYPVHRMVAETFIPNPSDKPEVNHLDGNKQDNRVENLAWATRSENMKHAHDSGFIAMRGRTAQRISQANSRFTEEERREIRRLHGEEGLSRRELARKYGVTHTCISDVIHDRYGHVELTPFNYFEVYLDALNGVRRQFLETNDKRYWRMLIQMLPDSFNQMRTVTLNYEVLRAMYHDRRGHRLSEWKHEFCEWVRSLPYSSLITLEFDDAKGAK